ncbi:hypothetical protein PAXINDRAFT_69043, partial [Paxillus involutus ATCC 200175]
VHPAFHANLLCIHVPNDDCQFPGRQLSQITGIGQVEEHTFDRICNHHRKGCDSIFEILYTTSNSIWLPYSKISRLEALTQYLEVQNIASIDDLSK